MRKKTTRPRIEFGDFQTPEHLVKEICAHLRGRGIAPKSVVEPTCGTGNFLLGAIKTFVSAGLFLGIDRNGAHLNQARNRIPKTARTRVELKRKDFFSINWEHLLSKLPQPFLILGNPPWVTNSELGNLGSANLPPKHNLQNRKGIEAITGKSNFDISEWMVIQLLERMQNHDATLAVLCKTTVARKVLRHTWSNRIRIAESSIHTIDAKRSFSISASACLLVCKTGPVPAVQSCEVYDGISTPRKRGVLGIYRNEILANAQNYEKQSRLDGTEHRKWRSGVKHDCAKIMELVPENGLFRNGQGERVNIEPDYAYPLFKSSDIAKNATAHPKRWVIIPQKYVGDPTSPIESRAPRTWAYLVSHAEKLDSRKSAVYRNKPRFSIFGIGAYAFAPWKVAISGLYKKIRFTVVPPFQSKPGMVDDTCYFIPCQTGNEALFFAKLLNSDIAGEFLNAFIFWDAKRPITAGILRRLDLAVLADELGQKACMDRYLTREMSDRSAHPAPEEGRNQPG